jgi:hypothetical protein
MAKNFIWCGYLEAGDKSTPVVIDDRLETGNPETMYLFNLKRNEILTYNRGIVQPKLRELRDDEAGVVQDLKNAFSKARRGFKIRMEPVAMSAGRRQKAVNDRTFVDNTEDLSDIGVEYEPVTDEEWSDDSDD